MSRRKMVTLIVPPVYEVLLGVSKVHEAAPGEAEALEYEAARKAAYAVDETYQQAAVAEHGEKVGRWAKHENAATIAAQKAKHAADARMHAALHALRKARKAAA